MNKILIYTGITVFAVLLLSVWALADQEVRFANIPWGSSFTEVKNIIQKEFDVELKMDDHLTGEFNMYFEESTDGYLGWLVRNANCEINYSNSAWQFTAYFNELDQLIYIELFQSYQSSATQIWHTIRAKLISKYGVGKDIPMHKEKFNDYEFQGSVKTKSWTYNSNKKHGDTSIDLIYTDYPPNYGDTSEAVCLKYTNKLFTECADRAKKIAKGRY